MPITVQYQPNANLLGNAAYDVGFGEYLRQQRAEQLQQQQLAEQQREFDARNQLAQQEFGAGRQDAQFRQQLAQRQDYLQRYGLMQQDAQASAHRQAQVQMAGQQAQYGLAHEALQQQGELQRMQMAQAGQNWREQQGVQSSQQIARMRQVADIQDSEWKSLLPKLAQLNPDERQQVEDQFHKKWEGYGLPMPGSIQMPPPPDWQNPEKIWASDNEYYDKLGLPRSVPDEHGLPSRRGAPQYPQTPQGMEHQARLKLNEIAVQNQARNATAEGEMYRGAVHDDIANQFQHEKLSLEQRANAIKLRADIQTKIAGLRSTIAQHKMQKDADGNMIPVDMSAAEAEVANLQSMLESIVVPGPYQRPGVGGGLPPQQPYTPGMNEATNGAPQPASPKQLSANPDEATQQWSALQPGEQYVDPKGVLRTKGK